MIRLSHILKHAVNTLSSIPLLLNGILVVCSLITLFAITLLFQEFIALISGTTTIRIKGQPATFETLRSAWLLMLGLSGFFLAAGTIAYSLWMRRAWSREIILATVIFCELAVMTASVLSPSQGELTSTAIIFIIFLTFVSWYLYFKRTVVQYFEKLSKSSGAT